MSWNCWQPDRLLQHSYKPIRIGLNYQIFLNHHDDAVLHLPSFDHLLLTLVTISRTTWSTTQLVISLNYLPASWPCMVQKLPPRQCCLWYCWPTEWARVLHWFPSITPASIQSLSITKMESYLRLSLIECVSGNGCLYCSDCYEAKMPLLSQKFPDLLFTFLCLA